MNKERTWSSLSERRGACARDPEIWPWAWVSSSQSPSSPSSSSDDQPGSWSNAPYRSHACADPSRSALAPGSHPTLALLSPSPERRRRSSSRRRWCSLLRGGGGTGASVTTTGVASAGSSPPVSASLILSSSVSHLMVATTVKRFSILCVVLSPFAICKREKRWNR